MMILVELVFSIRLEQTSKTKCHLNKTNLIYFILFSNIGPKYGLMSTELTSILICVFLKFSERKAPGLQDLEYQGPGKP